MPAIYRPFLFLSMYFTRHIPPIVYLTVAFIVGIVIHGAAISYYLPLALAAIALITLSAHRHVSYNFPLVLVVMAGASGTLSIYMQQYNFAHTTLSLPAARCDIQAHITDVVHTPTKTFPFRCTLQVEKIRKHTKHTQESVWNTTSLTMHLFCRTHADLRAGMFIELKNILLTGITNKELMLYAIKEGIACSSFISTPRYAILKDTSDSWLYKKHDLTQHIAQQLSPNCFWLFSSIFLGNKTHYYKDQTQTRNSFNQWGIAHHLARSGLHLVILIFIWQWLMRFIPVHFFLKQLIFICLSFIYLHLSWASIPFYRALWTFLIHRICLFMRIRPHMIHIICLVCLLCLLKNPVQLFFLDFQLSFALTFALIVLGHIENIHKN